MTDNVIKLVDWRVKREIAARRRAAIAARVVQRPITEVDPTESSIPQYKCLFKAQLFSI
jgi:hypothetical protein